MIMNKENVPELAIRAHHGLCTMFFENKGYSDGFTVNIAAVIERLSKNPYVEIMRQEDIICGKCPNNRGGVCTDTAKVNRYDAAVLELCGLRAGDVLPWADLQSRIIEKIIKEKKFSAVCGDCCWAEICHK